MERNFIDGYTEWQSNPEIVAVNKLPQHATLMPYGSFDEAKAASLLELPENQELAALIPVGFPDEEPVAPRRKAVEDLLTYK